MVATALTEHSYWLALAFVAWKFQMYAILINKLSVQHHGVISDDDDDDNN